MRPASLHLTGTIGKVGSQFADAGKPGGIGMLSKKDYVRVKGAAELLGVSPNTVRAWGALGKIPEYRHPVNNYRLYKLQDLEHVTRAIEPRLPNEH